MNGPLDTGDQLDVDGPAAPPRANGELVFTAPWQSRLFAATMRLRERELLEWETFRQGLITQISAHEAEIDGPDDYDYWGCWQRALEDLLDDTGLVAAGDVDTTAQAVAARQPDH